MRASPTVALAAVALATAMAATAARPLKNLTRAERLAYLRRGRIWQKVDIPAMDVRRGPQIKGAFAPMQEVTCQYNDKKMGGTTEKFACVIPPDDMVKVRYQPPSGNGKVYASVAGTRVLWALGFFTDAEYPVRVTCLGCPEDPWNKKEPRLPKVVFDRAVIERHPYVEVAEAGKASQWGWDELKLVDEAQGGSPPAHLDGAKLLAAFIQHHDNKAINQHLDCERDAVRRDEAGNETCEAPLLSLKDPGNTFGHGSWIHGRTVGCANYREWSRSPLWKDPARCQAELPANFTHPTLKHPVISEAGRRFLADLLMQLTEDQIRGIFEVSDMPNRRWREPEDRDKNGTLEQWVAAFHARRDQIVNHTCPQ
jgi:hypothetical protein